MPNCFELVPKGKEKAALLIAVDEAICKHLGVEVHPVNYCHEWYDNIGFSLALGRTFKELRERYTENGQSTLLKIVDFLDENYTVHAWAER